MLAAELGLRPGPRAQIVTDIKQALVSLVDERGIVPVIVLDDAQGLRDELLHELHGLTSLDFDGRDYLTVWLVGHPLLARRLRLQQHASLAQRIVRPAGRQDRPPAFRRHDRSRPSRPQYNTKMFMAVAALAVGAIILPVTAAFANWAHDGGGHTVYADSLTV